MLRGVSRIVAIGVLIAMFSGLALLGAGCRSESAETGGGGTKDLSKDPAHMGMMKEKMGAKAGMKAQKEGPSAESKGGQ